MPPFALERFGFCGPGEAFAFVRKGRIGLGGALPTNASGGLLAEGHVRGWNETMTDEVGLVPNRPCQPR